MEDKLNKYEQGQVFLIDKPYKWTSFDVIRKVRDLIKIRKVGHAGTLDPLATGLLIVCTGKFTKSINDYMAQEKEYTGSITLGATTATFDLEGERENIKDVSGITEDQVKAAVKPFTGEILQVPPMHSAIKKNGKRVYELARRGETIELEPRKLFIRIFEITAIEMPVVYFRVVCSTGTYIRSLANDFGAALGCGGYLSSLCRTAIGDFRLESALNIEQLEKQVENDRANP
ncbi:MAG: tRNA pseudouridine(55) synthase TruB [Chitinophagaceae bacterium]